MEDKKETKPSRQEGINVSKLTELRCLVDKLYSQTAVNQDDETYQANYALVNSLPDKKIIDFINCFNERAVNADPHFYSALIVSAGERGLERPHF